MMKSKIAEKKMFNFCNNCIPSATAMSKYLHESQAQFIDYTKQATRKATLKEVLKELKCLEPILQTEPQYNKFLKWLEAKKVEK